VKTSLRFILSFLGLIVGIVCLTLYLRINQVECFISGSAQQNSQVCQQLQSLIRTRLLFRDLATDPMVNTATVISSTNEVFSIDKVTTSLNGEVVFYLIQTEPLYRYTEANEKKIYTESSQSRTDDPLLVLPEVIDPQQVFMADFSSKHLFIVSFLKTLTIEKTILKEIIFMSDNQVKLIVDNYPNFILDSAQDPVAQAKKFQIIYQQLKPKEIDILIQEIDLRFELPVLKTYESSNSAELLIDSQE